MDLLQQYKSVRLQSLLMCEPLITEDFVPQSEFFASPPKWNLAHTSWFFEEFILKSNYKNYKHFHPTYAFLFNSYYEGAGKRTSRDERGSLSRPSVKEIYDYRAYVDRHMEELLCKEISDEMNDLAILGLNHEQQHQELFFTDHKYSLSRNPLYPAYSAEALAEKGEMPELEYLKLEGGLVAIGHAKEGFAFDNEKPSHKVYVAPFEISNRLVSNGEFIEFINDGAYNNYEYWHEEGWKWVNEHEILHPLYWQKENDKWHQFTLAGLREIKSEHPLTHINYYEAFAFAQWKKMRLPTEFEWETAANRFHWGDRWEWTESSYLPYPGYEKAEGTVGEYNGKFMVNQKVLRGASLATPNGHARLTYRNFFHPHLGWQFTGIRLAK
jgi:ergothioneine biosynthesis protein EgtB